MKISFRSPLIFQICLLAGSLLATQVQASIVITGTRIIYPADQREVTVKLSNQSKAPLLVQSWIDDGDIKATPDSSMAPFLLTPPITRIDGNKGQTLRVRYTGQKSLPQNVESLFWLNVLEVPSTVDDGKDKLKLAFRTRIKFFYRPPNLEGDVSTAPKSLQWRVQSSATGLELECSNPTPYYMTLSNVSLKANGHTATPKLDLKNSLIAPGEHKRLPLTTFAPNVLINSGEVVFSVINDFGGTSDFTQALKP